MKHLLLISLIFLSTLQVFSQNNKKTLYDDWPVTVKSNAESSLNKKNKSDLSTNFVLIGTSWNHRLITYFFQNGTDDLAGNDERQAIRNGFAVWAAQTDLAFLEVCTEAEADIVLAWGSFNHGDNGPFDGPGGVLGHTLGGPPPNVFGNQAGDIHFDDSETWTLATRTTNANPIDLVSVATHEIGHALGLDHTTVPGSIMLANYTGSRRALGSDDIAGIKNLYGQTPTGTSLVTGTNLICNSGSLTLQNVPTSANVTWSISPTYIFSSSSGTGATANLARGQYGGKYSITYNVQTNCGTTTVSRINLWGGNPGLQQMTFGTEGSGQTNTVNTVNFVSPNTWYVIRSNTELAQLTSGVSWSPSTSINGYSNGSHEYRFSLNSGQSVNIAVSASNTCGTASRTISFSASSGYSVSPNPATDIVTVNFDNTDNIETLPQQINLISEDSTKPLQSIKIKDIFINKAFKDGKKIDISVKEFPRGIYYLQVINPNNKSKEVDIIRILLK